MNELRGYVKELLLSTRRDGMENLITEMERLGYFTSPSSTRFHCAFDGGLMVHSLSMFAAFDRGCEKYGLSVPRESRIIAGLLHDLCKADAYDHKLEGGYSFKRSYYGTGHAMFSLQRIEQFVEPTHQEGVLIRFHMGMYGTREFSNRGAYSISELSNAFNAMPETKLFYFCDDMSAQFMETDAMIESGEEWFRPHIGELCKKLQSSVRSMAV